MTDSLSQYCLNCETQANTIEELRAANERWVIAFNQAEADATGRIEALLADNARMREALVSMRQAAAGFALAVREIDKDAYYPWPEFYAADALAYAALQETER